MAIAYTRSEVQKFLFSDSNSKFIGLLEIARTKYPKQYERGLLDKLIGLDLSRGNEEVSQITKSFTSNLNNWLIRDSKREGKKVSQEDVDYTANTIGNEKTEEFGKLKDELENEFKEQLLSPGEIRALVNGWEYKLKKLGVSGNNITEVKRGLEQELINIQNPSESPETLVQKTKAAIEGAYYKIQTVPGSENLDTHAQEINQYSVAATNHVGWKYKARDDNSRKQFEQKLQEESERFFAKIDGRVFVTPKELREYFETEYFSNPDTPIDQIFNRIEERAKNDEVINFVKRFGINQEEASEIALPYLTAQVPGLERIPKNEVSVVVGKVIIKSIENKVAEIDRGGAAHIQAQFLLESLKQSTVGSYQESMLSPLSRKIISGSVLGVDERIVQHYVLNLLSTGAPVVAANIVAERAISVFTLEQAKASGLSVFFVGLHRSALTTGTVAERAIVLKTLGKAGAVRATGAAVNPILVKLVGSSLAGALTGGWSAAAGIVVAAGPLIVKGTTALARWFGNFGIIPGLNRVTEALSGLLPKLNGGQSDQKQEKNVVLIIVLILFCAFILPLFMDTDTTSARIFEGLGQAGTPPDRPSVINDMEAMGLESAQLNDPEIRHRLFYDRNTGEIHGAGVNYEGDLPNWSQPLKNPTSGGVITQTPADHNSGVPLYDNAYDIAPVASDTNNDYMVAYATHDGYVVGYGDGVLPGQGGNKGWGNYIILGGQETSTNPKYQSQVYKFFTIYAHLAPGFSSDISSALAAFDAGGPPVLIPAGTELGIIDDTGNSTGDHIHYGFQGTNIDLFIKPSNLTTP